MILSPTTLSIDGNGDQFKSQTIQVSAHTIESIPFLRECQFIFPDVDVNNIIALPTMQHAMVDLVSFGEAVENEKDRLLEAVI
jgi:hypothetical protein